MDEEYLKKRTTGFAHRCVKLALPLPENVLGRHVRSQLIRCSTSVAANYRAVCVAQSMASFASKLGIVIEEADESHFWMEFIVEEKILDTKKVSPLLNEAKELTAIFIASRKTVNDRSPEFATQSI